MAEQETKTTIEITIQVWHSDEDKGYIAALPKSEPFQYLSAVGETPESALRELLNVLVDVMEDGQKLTS